MSQESRRSNYLQEINNYSILIARQYYLMKCIGVHTENTKLLQKHTNGQNSN